jgi:hypothetical protein
MSWQNFYTFWLNLYLDWQKIYFIMVKHVPLVKTSIFSWLNLFFLAKHIFFDNVSFIINKTSTYWQNLFTHTSSYLPMHLQIVDLNCKNYNVKCEYCKGVVKSICSLIQTHDNDKPITSNVGIAIVGICFGNNSLPPI